MSAVASSDLEQSRNIAIRSRSATNLSPLHASHFSRSIQSSSADLIWLNHFRRDSLGGVDFLSAEVRIVSGSSQIESPRTTSITSGMASAVSGALAGASSES
ncbi:Uncharacterised protein [Mycobacteroides abscessus subsp. abscessus]|nr:Uncharacterised protein [Mycobacteroides abscessus subsp. abscessus]SKV36553.1 Uncharacterised protein [Mycobacteroides abscessus subsp. abscessus]